MGRIKNRLMGMKYNLVEVLGKNFETIKDKFIGRQDIKVIKNHSETIEDRFQNQVMFLLENLGDHSSNSEIEELEFINKKLHSKLQPTQNKDVQKVEYLDNYENLIIDNYSQNEEYFEKLQLLLVHYKPSK